MALVLLTMGRLPRGEVAPGTVFGDDELEAAEVAELYNTGAVFGDDSTLGEAFDVATAMRLRGAPPEDVEAYLMTFAGDDVSRLVQLPLGYVCRKLLPPPALPISRVCNYVQPWAHYAALTDERPLILMRGLRASSRLLWAGSTVIEPPTKELCTASGCEFVDPNDFAVSPLPAVEFAEASIAARKRGAWTWEANELAAARARLIRGAVACSARQPMPLCPPGYMPDAFCQCQPYSIGTAI